MVGCNSLAEILEAREVLEESRALLEHAYQLRQNLGASRMGYVHGSLPGSMLALARVAAKQGDIATATPLLAEALPMALAMRDSNLKNQIKELTCHLEAIKYTCRNSHRSE